MSRQHPTNPHVSIAVGNHSPPSYLFKPRNKAKAGGVMVAWFAQCGRCSHAKDLLIDDFPLRNIGIKEATQAADDLGWEINREYGYCCPKCVAELRRQR